MSFVEIRSLSKEYRRGNEAVVALRHVDLCIQRGELLAVVGRDDSGKTTLLNLLAGLDRPTSGEIRVNGVDITRLSARRLAKWRAAGVGYISSIPCLIPVLTAYENAQLPLLLLPMSSSERRIRIAAALEETGILNGADRYPSDLTAAEQYQVAAARAIVTAPPLLVVDEPGHDLARESSSQVLGLLRSVHAERGITVVMATHRLSVAAIATRRVQTEHGELIGPLGGPGEGIRRTLHAMPRW
jgi:putative ABC transport system ATP-binding protein